MDAAALTRSAPSLLSLWRDRRGSTAVEFAFVLPVAAALLIATMSGAQMMSVINGMHFAVEEAARCYAVNKAKCASPTAAETYGAQKYGAGGAAPQFQASTAVCGRRVTATKTYEFMVGFLVFDIPLSATSCFPAMEA